MVVVARCAYAPQRVCMKPQHRGGDGLVPTLIGRPQPYTGTSRPDPLQAYALYAPFHTHF
jgi:hypothetical protein